MSKAQDQTPQPRTVSKSQRAYDAIKSRILDGSYSHGYRLVLDQLAREFDVSVVPVREAIRRLEAEQLVDFERNVGARVSGINPVEYRHTMQTLAIVEGAATALSVPLLTEGHLERACEINERMRRSLDQFDPVTFTALNRDFHQTLYAPCPNPTLLDVVERSWARLASIRDSTFTFVPGRSHESVAEHDQIIDLIRSGADAGAVELCCRAHRLATLDAFLSRDPASDTVVPKDIR
jgi:DNA-binding GntR family transcriptional regulator